MIKDISLPSRVEGCLHNIETFSKRRLQLQCAHAVALSSTIYGTHDRNGHESDSDTRWSTELDSEVSSITSTHDGSVIAVATVNGSICLLRGNDGRILLSKSISATSTSSSTTTDGQSHDGTNVPPKITFVQNARDDQDILVIYNLDNRRGQNEEVMNVILLTNIHGSELNSNDLSITKQSLSKLSLHGIIFRHGQHPQSNCFEMMKALFLSSKGDVIRFVVCNQQNNCQVSVYDYTVEQKEIHTVKEGLLLNDIGQIQDLRFDVILGGMTSTEKQQKSMDVVECFILVIYRRCGQLFLEWYDVDSLQRVGEYYLTKEMDETMCYTVEAFCALVPWKEHIVAVAVAMSSKSMYTTDDRPLEYVDDDSCVAHSSQIVVLQGIVSSSVTEMSWHKGVTNQEERSCEKEIITGVHEVYSINVETGCNIIDLVNCPIAECGECAFRYCAVLAGVDGNVMDIKFQEFRSGLKNVISNAKLLLANHLFDEAQKLVSSSSTEELSTPYGTIHVSDIVLARFKYMIGKPQILTGERKEQVKECLRRLSFGAVSGGSRGVQCLILASKAIYHLEPKDDDISCSLSGPYIRDYRLTLLAMAMSISNALKGVSNKFVNRLKNEMKMLEEKATVLKTIELTLGVSSGKNKLELTPPLLQVKNHKELYHLLIEKGAFLVAEDVRKSEMGMKFISPVDMAESVLKIPSKIDPRKYCSWIKDIVIPRLNIQQTFVVSIAKWACKTADEFDQEISFGIDSSILLLEIVGNALKKLVVDNHGSFSNRLIFDSCDDQHVSEGFFMVEFSNISQSEYSRNDANLASDEFLTSLVMKDQVSSFPLGKAMDTQDKFVDIGFMSILNVKLRNAKIIRKARDTGLPYNALNLSTFDESNGPNFAAKELVRQFFMNAWSDYLSDHGNQKRKVKEFCQFINMPFDNAIHLFAIDLCSLGSVDPSILARAHDLVSLCSKPEIKCDITLRFLQLAQLSPTKPTSLKILATEVLAWANNEQLRSELQEASRLLGIDEILRKYCGDKATEFFRVSDPIHSIRLVDYIITTKYADPSVLSDVLYLCNAFTHISAVDKCSRLLLRKIETLSCPSDVSKCMIMLEGMYEKNKDLGESVAARVCLFCANSMRSDFKVFTCEESRQRQYEVTCVAAIEICRISCARSPTGNIRKAEKSLFSGAQEKSWAKLLREFRTLLDLQRELKLCISLYELRRRYKSDTLAATLVKDALKDLERTTNIEGRSLRIRLNKAKRALSLLFYEEGATVVTSKWCKAVGNVACKLVSSNNGEISILLLENAGVLDEIHNPTAYQAIIMVVLTLCSKAANCNNLDEQRDNAMRSLILANSLLQDHALVFCPATLLPYMVFLGNLVDVATQIILRFDCGVGEQMETFKRKLLYASKARLSPLEQISDEYQNDALRANTANIILHPSWHCGDGLLLPPYDTLSECITYCKEILSPTLGNSNVIMLGIHNFLEDRGAYSLSLRMLMNASAVTNCNHLDEKLLQRQIEVLQGILFKLAERSLGGSGTGNTSGKIDFEMAVPLLLTLHMKVAFKAYKRCLPSAISSRDYERVIALTSVGSRASGITFVDERINKSFSRLTWTNQTTFSHQCQSLAKKAFWWNVLKKVGVQFTPSQFDEGGCYQEKKVKYITSLLFEIVRMASQFIKEVTIMHSLITDFCAAFDLDHTVGIQKHIEYLLSMPEKIDDDAQIVGFDGMDVRYNIEFCCTGVRKLLRKLPTTSSRSTTLRNCLIAMEKIDSFGKDFERYAAVLSLYQEELREIIFTQSNLSPSQSPFFRQELELVNRRQDALAIINSIFGDRKLDERPSVQRCFFPLSDSPKDEKECPKKMIGILGEQGLYGDDVFDPILPLVPCLKSDTSQSILSSLAPICFAIGVPSGYVHARALILRVLGMKLIGSSPPPFVSEVLPVIKRLKSPKDGAELAEWCASQYDKQSKERLLCLEVGLDLAMKASTLAEQMLLASRHKDNSSLIENEKSSLERVERISSAKSALSDSIAVQSVLQNSVQGINDFAVRKITTTLVDKARSHQSQGPEITPEEFVENLLIEGSLACAESCLDTFMPLDTFGFYLIASAVHKACKELEDQYSHIDISRIARSLVRRYLLHGDEALVQPNEKRHDPFLKRDLPSKNESLDMSIDEDTTINLVLDLNLAPGRGVWGDDLASEEPELKRAKTMAVEEEQPFLNSVTDREKSEYMSRRVGLRVAFIMSFAHDIHSQLGEDSCNDENLDPNLQTPSIGQLSETLARKHAVYLLNFVFSNSPSSERNNNDMSTIMDETAISCFNPGIHDRDNLSTSIRSSKSSNTLRGRFKDIRKALTFAMRHRALRAACALCPERLLQEIIAEEGYLDNMEQREMNRGSQSTSKVCLLSKYCFGTFVAKEIEAMGLALPHSDLIQLSMMHHPSYARTLWRNHGKSSNLGFQGRLMLLILELSLREMKVIDADLVQRILEKVDSLNSPRTHLLVCECLAQLPDEEQRRILSHESKISSLWLQLLRSITVCILDDLSTSTSGNHKHNDVSSRENSLESSILTMQRWIRLSQTFWKNANYAGISSRSETENKRNLLELQPLLFVFSLALEAMLECTTHDENGTKYSSTADDIPPPLKPTDSPIWKLCQYVLAIFESSLNEFMQTALSIPNKQDSSPKSFAVKSPSRQSFNFSSTKLQTILNQLKIHEEEAEKDTMKTHECSLKRAEALLYQKIMAATNMESMDTHMKCSDSASPRGETTLAKKDKSNESDCLALLLLRDKTLHDEMWKRWSSSLSSSSLLFPSS